MNETNTITKRASDARENSTKIKLLQTFLVKLLHTEQKRLYKNVYNFNAEQFSR
jgi:hypothetical protein